MKLVLTTDEIKVAAVEFLEKRGYRGRVNPQGVEIDVGMQGEYDMVEPIFRGITVEASLAVETPVETAKESSPVDVVPVAPESVVPVTGVEEEHES